MVKKIITWVDLQGRYRVTSPAYNDRMRPAGETEDECLARVWDKLTQPGNQYGIGPDHPHFYVEDEVQRERVKKCCGTDFRYGAIMRPDLDGKLDSDGAICLCKDARYGAWEMDVDGCPKVNMAKARGVHMDKIRVVRNAELAKKDLASLRAIEAGDTSAQSTIATEKQTLRDIPQTFDLTTDTPEELKAKWPDELPARE